MEQVLNALRASIALDLKLKDDTKILKELGYDREATNMTAQQWVHNYCKNTLKELEHKERTRIKKESKDLLEHKDKCFNKSLLVGSVIGLVIGSILGLI